MALTDRSVGDETATEPRPTGASRSLWSRLSLGHVVAVLVGLIALLLNLAFLRSGADRVEILVAATDLNPGDIIDAQSTASAELGDAGDIVSSLIGSGSLDRVLGSVVARPINDGEPIRGSDLRPQGSSGGLREMSIEIDEARAAGGRLVRGDVVDVIAVVDDTAAYIASGLEIVAVNQDNGAGFGATRDYFIVVSVDDQTALTIAAAMRQGSIDVLRSTGAPPPSPAVQS